MMGEPQATTGPLMASSRSATLLNLSKGFVELR